MNETSHDDQWNKCPPGELRALAGRLRGQQRRRAIGRALASSAAIVLLVCVAVVFTGNPFGSAMPGGIACHDVQAAIGDYVANRVAPELREKIDAHLVECEACREVHRHEQENAAGIEAAVRVATIVNRPTLAVSWLIWKRLSS